MANAVPIDHEPSKTATAARQGMFAKYARRQIVPRIVLIAICAYYLLPFYWMFASALKPVDELVNNPRSLYPHNVRWANFSEAVEVFPFWQFLKNTSIITGLTVIGVALTNPIVAYGFSRLQWPGRDKVFMVVLATVFIPYPALIVALFDIFAQLQWVNSFKPLVIPYFFCFIPAPFWIFLLRQFFMQIPQEISDAARLDGAGELRILFQVIMPQSWPALGAVSLFGALHAWNDFLGPLIYLHDTSKYTLSIGLTFFSSQTEHNIKFNLLMAASVLVIMPVVALFLSFQRTFVEGVTVGGFK